MKNFPDTVPIVDISYWNTADGAGGHIIDPARLIDAGIRAVIVRAGKGHPSQSTDHGVDRHFTLTVPLLESAGIPWMPYWRIYDPWYESGSQQAARFVDALNSVNFDAHPYRPIWIDVEEWVDSDEAQSHQLGPNFLEDWLTDFRYTLAAGGYDHHGVYARKSWWDQNVVLPWGHLPLFVAHWVRDEGERPPISTEDARVWDEFVTRHQPDGPALPGPWFRWAAWQFAGEGSQAGRGLGFASEHLDCGLLRRDEFDRWGLV